MKNLFNIVSVRSNLKSGDSIHPPERAMCRCFRAPLFFSELFAKIEPASLRGCPEMGTRAAARTVAKPFRLTKVPVGWGFWQSGARRWVVHLAKNRISGQPLRNASFMV